MMKILDLSFMVPSSGELKDAVHSSEVNPEELTDRQLWILKEFGRGSQ